MPQINIDTNYAVHRKTIRLIKMLENPEADIFPIRLWIYCGNHHPDGRLLNYTTQEIEDIMKWRGKAGQLLEALIHKDVKFLLKKGAGYLINGWNEINGHLIEFKRRSKIANTIRWSSYRQQQELSLLDPTRSPLGIKKESSIRTIRNVRNVRNDTILQPGSKDFQEAVSHLLKKWIFNGAKYPFCKADGGIIKRLLSYYGLAKVMALIDLFWDHCDDWTRVHIGKNTRGLQHELAKLLDNPKLKDLEKKYEDSIDPSVKNQIQYLVKGKQTPAPPDFQKAKLVSIEKEKLL